MLEKSTSVSPHDDGTYSARAYFTVQGESVSLRCVSAAKAAVVAFIDYIDNLFRNDSTKTDWSLEDIVSNARQNIMNRFSLSEDEMTVTYIDQFDNTHVVEISVDRWGLRFASRQILLTEAQM